MRVLIHRLACREHLRSGSLPATFFGSERGGQSKCFPLPPPRSSRLSEGFALLLTLIVIGVIGAVAFGVGYLTLHEYAATTRFQDSQSALQAAEAGIEDGLLRFRMDRNTEVPFNVAGAPCPDATIEPTQTSPYVLRVNLTTTDATKRLQCLDPTTSPAPNPSDIVYDLKVYFKGSQLGAFDSSSVKDLAGSNSPTINKDQVLEMTGISVGTTEIDIRYAPIDTATADSSIPLAQIDFLGDNGLPVQKPFLPSKLFEGKFGGASGFPFAIDPTQVKTIRFRPEINNVKIASRTNGPSIDFGFSQFESSGYSNGVKRKLTSAVNRQSGSTQGVYNFVLFGGAGALGQN